MVGGVCLVELLLEEGELCVKLCILTGEVGVGHAELLEGGSISGIDGGVDVVEVLPRGFFACLTSGSPNSSCSSSISKVA